MVAMKDNNKTAFNADAQQLKDEGMIAFSMALGQELDSIGYTPSPGRSTALAKDLKLSRTQSYRLLKGLSFPNLECLVAMRWMGLSIDRMLDNASQRQPVTQNVRIDGRSVSVVLQPSNLKKTSVLAAIPNEDGTFDLKALVPGQLVPSGAIAVQGLQVPIRSSIAIIEDDLGTLDALAFQMRKVFHVAPFPTGTSFLEIYDRPTNFSAFLVDWRLPDVNGDELVKAIRTKSSEPIFILTGDEAASDEIARAMDYNNVHHVAKPISGVILIKRLAHAMNTPLTTTTRNSDS